jgi:methylmalonyl-CoA/ethylmalonyl-CoA epimerase
MTTTGLSVVMVVADLDPAVAHFRSAFGLAEPAYADSAVDKVRVAMFDLGGSQLHLVAPTADDSPMADHIAKRGEGFHHIGLFVDSVDDVLAGLRAAGLRTLGDTARPGAGGNLVGFVHPKSTYNTIVEVIQRG